MHGPRQESTQLVRKHYSTIIALCVSKTVVNTTSVTFRSILADTLRTAYGQQISEHSS